LKGCKPDILATSAESLKIWEIEDNKIVKLKADLINVKQPPPNPKKYNLSLKDQRIFISPDFL